MQSITAEVHGDSSSGVLRMHCDEDEAMKNKVGQLKGMQPAGQVLEVCLSLGEICTSTLELLTM